MPDTRSVGIPMPSSAADIVSTCTVPSFTSGFTCNCASPPSTSSVSIPLDDDDDTPLTRPPSVSRIPSLPQVTSADELPMVLPLPLLTSTSLNLACTTMPTAGPNLESALSTL